MFTYQEVLTLRSQILANPALTAQLCTMRLEALTIAHEYGEDAMSEFVLEDCGELVLCTPLGAECLVNS